MCFFTCSPRPPTLSQRHMDLHVWAYPRRRYIFQVSSKSVQGFRSPMGSKFSLSHYFGYSLLQQLVLPYKPWSDCRDVWPRGVAYIDGRTDGRRSGGRHGRQAASAERLRAGIEGSGGGVQAKIAISRHMAWLTRPDGRAGRRLQAIPPQSGVTACDTKTSSSNIPER